MQARSRVTHAKLLRAALELFSGQGFDATSVGELCERAGVSRGTFYYHFPSKEALFIAVANARGPSQELFTRALASPATTQQMLDGMLRVFVDAIGRMPGDDLRRIVLEMLRGSLAGEPVSWVLRENVARVVARGQARGEVLVDLDPHDVAATTFGAVLASVVDWLGGGGADDPAQLQALVLRRTRLIAAGWTTASRMAI